MRALYGIALAAILFLTQLNSATASINFSIHPAGSEESWFVYNGVQPGAVINDAVAIINPLDEKIILALYALDASTLKDGGFAPAAEETKQRNIGAWLKLKENMITLTAKSSAVVTFAIRIPTTVVPARYAGVILLARAPETQPETDKTRTAGSKVGIATRVGVRVYINIAGAPAAQDDNKNYVASIAKKSTQNVTQRKSSPTPKKQHIQQTINAVIATTSTSTAAIRKDEGALKKYLIQIGQFVIDNKRKTLWIIGSALLLLLALVWHKRKR